MNAHGHTPKEESLTCGVSGTRTTALLLRSVCLGDDSTTSWGAELLPGASLFRLLASLVFKAGSVVRSNA